MTYQADLSNRNQANRRAFTKMNPLGKPFDLTDTKRLSPSLKITPSHWHKINPFAKVAFSEEWKVVSESRRYTLVSTLDTEDNAAVDQRVDTSLIGSQPISVIIPTLNESANIVNLLIRLDQTLIQADIPYEAIVVDDHSTDDTIAVAEAIAIDKILPVRILTKQGRPGKSSSLVEGFAAARFDVLVMMDGDLQHPPEILPDMLHHLENSDIVVADRRSYKNPNRLRGLLSYIFIFIFSMLFGINTDIESGLKVFRRKVYEGLPPNLGRWGLDLHLVTQAVRKGNILINMPFAIQQRQGGKSKVKPLTVGMELLIAALHLKMTLVLDSITIRFSNRQQHDHTPQSNTVPNTPVADTDISTSKAESFPW